MEGKIKRQLMANYIDTALPSAAKPEYDRLGKDLEEYSVDMNANVSPKSNILGETSVILDSYQPQASVSPYYAEVGSPLFTRLQGIIDERLTLDELKTSVVEVHTWDTSTAGKYVAYRENAIIEVVSYGGDTTGYQIPFNVHHTGGRVKGTFDPTTKTFTAGSGPAA